MISSDNSISAHYNNWNNQTLKEDHSLQDIEVLARIIMINKFNTKITPIVLLRNDLKQLWNNKQYHSGKILFGITNGLAII